MKTAQCISELNVNNETIGLVAARLAAELHDFAATRNIGHSVVEAELSSLNGKLFSDGHDLIKVGPVVASSTTGLAVRIAFDPVAYLAIAQSAKDRMAGRLE